MAEETKNQAPADAPKKTAKKPAAEAKEVAAEAAPAAEVVEEKKGAPTAKDLLNEGLEVVKVRRAKGSKNISYGEAHVLATFNNTKVVFTDKQGNVLSWSSAGKCQFRGSRKSTAYAATVVTQDAARRAMAHGLKEVDVKLNGPGMGRDSSVRAIQALGLTINSVQDVTPVPHNGCRPPKRRRV